MIVPANAVNKCFVTSDSQIVATVRPYRFIMNQSRSFRFLRPALCFWINVSRQNAATTPPL